MCLTQSQEKQLTLTKEEMKELGIRPSKSGVDEYITTLYKEALEANYG